MIEQDNVTSLVTGQTYINVREDGVFMHVSSPAFDAATFEIWGGLC
jgi:hypothetical protein